MKKTTQIMLMGLMSFNLLAQEVAQPVTEASVETTIATNQDQSIMVAPEDTYSEFQPFMENGNSRSTHTSYSSSSSSSGGYTESCLNLIRQRYADGNSSSEVLTQQNAFDQTKGKAAIALGAGAVTGVSSALITGNPVVGLGVGTVVGTWGLIGTAVERSKIVKTGRTLSASDKILSGQDLTRKEEKAFEKLRKKVSKKAYGDKNALGEREFASVVRQQDGLADQRTPYGENLFCDVSRKGQVNLLPQDRNMVKRLKTAALCNDSKSSRRSVVIK